MLASKSLAFFFVSLLTCTQGIDLSVKGDRCSNLDLCSTSNDASRTCECDKDCYKYGTCCVDAENFSLMTPENQKYHCYDNGVTSAVFVKRSCAEKFLKHSGHKSACLAEGDKRDVFRNVPVTSKKTSITYWNEDCAICNDEEAIDFKPWTVLVVCPKKYNEKSIKESDIKKNLTYDWNTGEWGVVIKEDIVHCSINLREPYEAKKLKRCAPNMIDRCPLNLEDDDLKERCAMYHGERKVKEEKRYFKNVHCALCNNASLKDLECEGRDYKSEKKVTSSDTQKVEFEEWKWLELLGEERYKCSENFGYDIFLKKCRERKLIIYEPRYNDAQRNSAVFVVLLLSVIFSYKRLF